MTLNRNGDRWKLPATMGGFLLLLIFGAMLLWLPKDRQPTEIVKYVLLALGSGLISPTFIVDLVRVWRGTSGTPPDG